MSDKLDIVKKSLVRRVDNILDYGKLPPQSIPMEEAVLGAVMIEKVAIYEVADILSVNSFYRDAHQKIWRAIIQLHNDQRSIDLLTVVEQLKKNGELDDAGGAFYVAQLTNKVGSAANVEEHARVIEECYLKRQLVSTSTDILKLAYEDTTDAFELLSQAQNMVDDINNSISGSEPFSDTVFNRAYELSDSNENNTKVGVQTYLSIFDIHTGGFQADELIIIAGRPSMGKSAVLADFGYQQAKNGMPVGIFSLEMSRTQLVDRFLSMETEVEYEKMRKGNMHEQELQRIGQAATNISELPIHIDDSGGIGICKLMSEAKMWAHKYGIKILYIDYLQLISTHDTGIKFGSREQEISYVSRKLKSLAKQLKIPIIALAQLSRAVEARADKRPILSDLRESGGIEQDADMVIFPFRPSYYQIKDEDGSLYSDFHCELIIAKFRNGKTKDLVTQFYPQFSKFYRGDSRPSGNFRQITEAEKSNEPF